MRANRAAANCIGLRQLKQLPPLTGGDTSLLAACLIPTRNRHLQRHTRQKGLADEFQLK